MTNEAYRSYVVRVRRRRAGPEPSPTTLDVEDLLQGGRASVTGDPAAEIADRLERLVEGSAPPPAAGADAERRPL